MNENSNCNLCQLAEHTNPKSVCLKGRGVDSAKLLILLDAPGIVEDKRSRGMVSEGVEYLDWLMARMSVPKDSYYLEYVLKCYPKPCKQFGTKAHRQQMINACAPYRIATLQSIRPKAVVCMGATACELVMGSDKVSPFEGCKWIPRFPELREFVSHVWITYSPAYGLQDVAESVGIYRVLLAAATEAGLKPKFNPKQKAYDHGT